MTDKSTAGKSIFSTGFNWISLYNTNVFLSESLVKSSCKEQDGTFIQYNSVCKHMAIMCCCIA